MLCKLDNLLIIQHKNCLLMNNKCTYVTINSVLADFSRINMYFSVNIVERNAK